MGSDRVPHRAVAIVAATLFTVTLPTGAAAQGLLVSPTRIDAQVRVGSRLPGVRVSNNTRLPLRVRVLVAPATQELSGLPAFTISRRSLAVGRRIVRVSPRAFRLAPGAQEVVVPIVSGGPRVGIGSYAVIGFEARELGREEEGRAVITPTLRLTTNLLLRFPGRPRIDGTVTTVRAEQGPRRTLIFFGRIRNTGNVHAKPRATLTVRRVGGRTVLHRRFKAENVLPRARRELQLSVKRRLAAGDYVARVQARVGRRRSQREARFRLVGPNELPTPALRVVSLPDPQPDANEDFDAEVKVENTGTASFAPRGTLVLARPGGGEVLERRPVQISELEPGQGGETEVELPGVASGRYELAVEFASGGPTLAERSLVFKTETRPPLLTRVQDWAAGHVALLTGLIALVFLLVVGALVAYIRKLRRAVQ